MCLFIPYNFENPFCPSFERAFRLTFADMRSCEAIWVEALQEPSLISAVMCPEGFERSDKVTKPRRLVYRIFSKFLNSSVACCLIALILSGVNLVLLITQSKSFSKPINLNPVLSSCTTSVPPLAGKKDSCR